MGRIMRRTLAALFILFIAGAALAFSAQRTSRLAPPAVTVHPSQVATAIFAGGCFWSTETDLDRVPGVISTTSGYTGGRVANPSYEQVSAGGTGHYESVRVVYDPRRISYPQLVARFFRTIDPVDPSGQFCDHGEQYRTAIFVANSSERQAAESIKSQVTRQLHQPVATAVLARAPFYPAEEYHQDYARKNPMRYRLYRNGCGRDRRVAQIWGSAAH
jgi:peptide-methionine (S)-S-oxide reductase